MRSLKTLQELIYENGGLTGGQTNSSFIYDYMVKFLGDTVASYEIDRVNLVDMTLQRDALEAEIRVYKQTHEFNKNTIKEQALEIEKYMKESATYQARKDTLEEWLGELRDNLKQGNTIDNDALVSEINELLNWPL